MLINFSLKYRFILLISLFVINGQSAFAQINFQKFPRDSQVLQRNDSNEAVLSVKGEVTEGGHSSVSLIVMQDGNVFSQNTINLDASKSFDFSTILRAGKFNYTVKLYLDGTKEVKSVTKVAVGDIYLIYGQSNALGIGGETYVPDNNPFIRYFYTNYFNVDDFAWVLPFETFIRPGAGALELQKLLCNNNDYPIAVISASEGGAELRSLSYRNPQNPTDKNTYYGKMLLQVIHSDLKDELKYFIFRQGESDSGNEKPLEYETEFNKFYNNLVLDFPKLTKFFNFQIDVLTEYAPYAGVLREFQRNTNKIFPKITVLSTVGTKEFDGLHYGLEGYKQTAFELSRVISKEVYGKQFSNQIYSPDLKKAYVQNEKLVLEFDESMEMSYPNDTTANGYFYQMKKFFFIDGNNTKVTGGIANGNKIILDVDDISSAKKISYLPNSFGAWGVQKYLGTHLKNKFGMRAFSFDNINIDGNVTVTPPNPVVVPPNPTPQNGPTIELSLAAHEDIMIKLTWNGNAQTKYHIERSTDNSDNFSEISTSHGDNYYDTQVNLGKKYYYRIYADNASSTKSSIKDITLKCLENVNLKTLPNVSYVGANISIAAIVTISNTKQLSLEAKKSIDLNHGFDAVLGSDFSAEIGGCKNN